MTVLETENLTHYYENGMAGAVAAIENINVKFEKGEIVGIIGHTGSGKSTLLQHLNGLLKPDSGRVLLCGEDINKDKRTLRAARFRVGLCFQYPEYQLFEETVYKDISFGPKNMGLDSAEIDRRVRRAAELLSESGLSIVEIASAVGYNSASQFGVAFKRRYQLTPSQFRRMAHSQKELRQDA